MIFRENGLDSFKAFLSWSIRWNRWL